MRGLLMWIGPTGLLAVVAGGYLIVWPEVQIWWQQNRRQHCEAQLQSRDATIAKIKSDAAEKLRLMKAEHEALELKVKESNNEHANREEALRLRHDIAFDKLRDAYTYGCDRVPEATTSAPTDDATTNRDRFRAGIAEGLTRRIVVPADQQAERLIWCQDYVRKITQ